PPEVRDDALRGRTGSGGGRAGAGLLTHPVGPSRRLRARGAGLGALRAPTGVVDSLGAPDVPGQGDYREQHRHRGPEAGIVVSASVMRSENTKISTISSVSARTAAIF